MSGDVLIFAEHERGAPRRIALELASKAADLAQELGGRVHALAIGPGSGASVERLGEFGVDVLHIDEDSVYDEFLGDPAVDAATSLVDSLRPVAVVLPNSQDGRDLGSRLAARLDTGAVANVIGLEVADGGVRAEETIFGGNFTTTVTVDGDGPAIFMVRPNAFVAEPKGKTAQVERLNGAGAGGTPRAKLGEIVQEEGAPVALDEAAIIVSGGRGLGGPEPFAMLADLADALGGVVGASRAAVDAGWISYPHQVGQTGKTVKPQVYVAIGISGAVQHRVGMQTADTIIAINKDPDAPIFQMADFGAVGDLFEIVPALTEEIRRRKNGR